MKEIVTLVTLIGIFFILLLKLSTLQAAVSSAGLKPPSTNPKQLRCYNSYNRAGWLPLWDLDSQMRYKDINCVTNTVNSYCDWPGYIAIGFRYDSGGTWGKPTCKLQCAATSTGPETCDWK